MFGGGSDASSGVDLARELANDIIWGTYAPGARIDCHGLAAMYGQSPERCRAAVEAAIATGLVVRDPNGTAFVAPLSRESARQQVARSAALSREAVARVAEHIERVDAARVTSIVSRLRQAQAMEDRMLEGRLIIEIHQTIYAAADEPDLSAEIDNAQPALIRIQALVFRGQADPIFVGLHGRIVQAVVQRDGEGLKDAYAVLWQHFAAAVEAVPDVDWPRG